MSKLKEKKLTVVSNKDVATVYLNNPACLPVPDQYGGFDLKVSGLLNAEYLPPRTAFYLDCGFSVEVPKGYRLDVVVDGNLAAKGVSLSMQTPVDGSKHSVKLVAVNGGKEIIVFKTGDTVGKLWFTPIGKVSLKVVK